jgi:hypothetical protein
MIPVRSLIAAAAAFLVGVTLFGSALLRAMAPPPVALEAPAPPPPQSLGGAPGEVLLDEVGMADVLDADPFQPDRQRPPRRYRLPGDVDPPPPPPPPPPPEIPHFRVSGTAVVPDGGFAVMRIADGPERMLALGDFLGGYRLHGITQDGVVMKNDEREVSVLVPGPAQHVASAPARPQPQPQPRAGQPQPQQRQQMTAEQARRFAEILEGARADGATPQMLQAIQQLIQQRGIDTFQNMDIVIEGGSMSVRQRRPPDGGQEERN